MYRTNTACFHAYLHINVAEERIVIMGSEKFRETEKD